MNQNVFFPNKLKVMQQKEYLKALKMTIVLVHINITLSCLFVQLPISFPVLLFYSLVDMSRNLVVPFVLFLSYVSDRRELFKQT